MKRPSSSRASGLISASVRSKSRKIFISSKTIGVSLFSSPPLTPVAAMASLAIRGVMGRMVENQVLETCSGCSSATCSMSIPPMSLNSSTGSLRRPSQVTETKYSWATGLFSSTSTERAFWPFTSMGMIWSKKAGHSPGVSANFTAPAFMRPPESTWLFRTTGPPISSAMVRASSAEVATRPLPRGRRRLANSALDSYS